MKHPKDWREIWRLLFSRRQMEADIEDEISFHIEGRVDALVESGLTEAEARRQVRARFGNEERVKAEMAAVSKDRLRRGKRKATMESILRDLRYALRQATRYPGFSSLLMLTIAVAIGGNVAIFSALEGIVLRPLPYPDADRIVAVWETQEGEGWHQPFTGPDYLDVREQAESFEEFGVVRHSSFNLSGDAQPTRVRGSLVTASVFGVLGVRPLHGRVFTEEEEAEGNNRVVVLSYGLWQTRYGGDPSVVGRIVGLDGNPHEVIGIMPADFRSPTPWGGKDRARLWVPLSLSRETSSRGNHSYGGLARMADGTTRTVIEAELQVIALQLAEEYPDTNARTRFFIEPLMALTLGGVSQTLVFLLAAVALVLLIACANVAGMLLARGMGRAPEFAIRASLGAGRRGLLGQVMTESLTLAILGGGMGVILAFWGVDAIKAVMPENIPRGELIQVNLRVLGFAFLITVGTGILVGIAPSVLAFKSDLAAVIRTGRASRGGRSSRFLPGMVTAQLGLGFVLVNAALVLAVSYANVMRQPNHFATEQTLVASLPLAGPAYDEAAERKAFYDGLLRQVRGLPGVSHAGLTSKLPLRGGSSGSVLVRDQVYDPAAQRGAVEYTFVGEDYHEAMGIPLLAGRTLNAGDMELGVAQYRMRQDSGSLVMELPVVINRAMAERYWPDGDPLGEVVRPNARDPHFRATVVGIVESVRQRGPERAPVPEAFFPYTAEVWGGWDLMLAVSAVGSPGLLSPSIREAVAGLDPDIPLPDPFTMDTVLDETTAGRRFSMLLVGLFAFTALILIVAGTYGVVSYSVGQRTHEIGVRMTLGADRRTVSMLFLERLGYLIVPGLVLGGLAAWAASTLTGSLVYGISALSPLHMAMAGGVMTLVALAATVVPVARATRVDPLEALRVD